MVATREECLEEFISIEAGMGCFDSGAASPREAAPPLSMTFPPPVILSEAGRTRSARTAQSKDPLFVNLAISAAESSLLPDQLHPQLDVPGPARAHHRVRRADIRRAPGNGQIVDAIDRIRNVRGEKIQAIEVGMVEDIEKLPAHLQ